MRVRGTIELRAVIQMMRLGETNQREPKRCLIGRLAANVHFFS